jgi:hypothetical protein
MNPGLFCAGVAVCVFVSGAIGLQLQRSLPEGHTTGRPGDMIDAVVGLMTLLLALVLGLLIWTAFGVFSTQKASIQTLAINALRFDSALLEFGPEADRGREILKAGLQRMITHIWSESSDGGIVARSFGYAVFDLKEREDFLETLKPSSDRQKSAQAQAMEAAAAIGQTRSQMAVAMVDPVSYPLISVVAAWAAFLFCGFGLLSTSHVMSYVALAVGALAVASACYVIIDLSSPYSGLFQVSSEAITDVIDTIELTSKSMGHH